MTKIVNRKGFSIFGISEVLRISPYSRGYIRTYSHITKLPEMLKNAKRRYKLALGQATQTGMRPVNMALILIGFILLLLVVTAVLEYLPSWVRGGVNLFGFVSLVYFIIARVRFVRSKSKSATSPNKRVSGSARYARLDPNLPFGQTSDTRQPLGDIGNIDRRCPMKSLLRFFIILALGFGFLTFIVGCDVQGIDNYNKGVKYQETGQTALAEQQYKIALQKNSDLAEAHLNLGLIYLNRGWYDGAEASTKKAVEILERTHRTLVEGSTWQQSLSLAYNNLGVVEIGRGAEKVSKLDFPTARIHWQNAMSFFRKAVELDPSNSQAQANIQRFKDAY